MSKLQIQKVAKQEQVLSKEQKRFNNFVKKIKNLKEGIEAVKAADLFLRREGEARVKPAEHEALQALHDLVLALHANPHQGSLTSKQMEKFRSVMQGQIGDLLDTTLLDGDEELRKLYAYYSDTGKTYAEEQEEDENLQKGMAAEMFKHMFGMDIEADDFDDPEKMKEKIQAKQEQFIQEEAERREKNENRKKSPKQLAAEEKRAAATTAIKKSVKQIYVDLVRHFHPDKEPDEARRAEKTETMKQITAAYEADDHLKLLELQITLLSGRDNVFADFNDTELRYFNESLQQQARDLEQELHFASPEGNGNPYAMLYSPSDHWMRHQIEQHIKEQQKIIQQVRYTLDMIQSPKGFKGFVKEYQLEDDFDLGPMEIMKMMQGFK